MDYWTVYCLTKLFGRRGHYNETEKQVTQQQSLGGRRLKMRLPADYTLALLETWR